MLTIEIPDELAASLQRIAARESRSVDEIARELLVQFQVAHTFPTENADVEIEVSPSNTNDLFTLIIQAAHELGESSMEGNISERSREILSTDFADYLLSRHRGQL